MTKMINKRKDRVMSESEGSNIQDNVIWDLFPGASKERSKEIRLEASQLMALNKTNQIDQVLEIVIPNLFEQFYENKFDFQNRHDTDKDMTFLIEAIRSLLNRHLGLDHPFQELADRYFVVQANGDIDFVVDAVESSVVKIKIDDNGDPYVEET